MEEKISVKSWKKTYQKPEICRVKLVPSEAVLSVCKTGGGNFQDCPPPTALNCSSTITGS